MPRRDSTFIVFGIVSRCSCRHESACLELDPVLLLVNPISVIDLGGAIHDAEGVAQTTRQPCVDGRDRTAVVQLLQKMEWLVALGDRINFIIAIA